MRVHYLEVVTSDVNAVCSTYERLHGLKFGPPDSTLGGARVAKNPGGGLLGIRAPMSDAEAPVVRPYVLVDDIDEAARVAAKCGGVIAHEPMELPGHGKFAIFIQGGIQHGVWQV